MLYTKREIFNNLSIRVGRFFAKLKLSPNQWTLLSLLPAMASFYFLIEENFFVASIFFFIVAFIDIVDGSVARVTGRVSRKGAYLDTIADRYVEFLIIFGLFFVSYPHFIFSSKTWLMILLFGTVMTTYAKAAAFEKGLVERELRGGFLERAERLALLFLIILVTNFSRLYAMYLLVAAAVLTNFSALQRIVLALKSWR